MKYHCKFCREEFEEPIGVDQGIGSYEYWGATGYHSEIVVVSPCCHEDYWEDSDDEFLIDTSGKTIQKEDFV